MNDLERNKNSNIQDFIDEENKTKIEDNKKQLQVLISDELNNKKINQQKTAKKGEEKKLTNFQNERNEANNKNIKERENNNVHNITQDDNLNKTYSYKSLNSNNKDIPENKNQNQNNFLESFLSSNVSYLMQDLEEKNIFLDLNKSNNYRPKLSKNMKKNHSSNKINKSLNNEIQHNDSFNLNLDSNYIFAPHNPKKNSINEFNNEKNINIYNNAFLSLSQTNNHKEKNINFSGEILNYDSKPFLPSDPNQKQNFEHINNTSNIYRNNMNIMNNINKNNNFFIQNNFSNRNNGVNINNIYNNMNNTIINKGILNLNYINNNMNSNNINTFYNKMMNQNNYINNNQNISPYFLNIGKNEKLESDIKNNNYQNIMQNNINIHNIPKNQGNIIEPKDYLTKMFGRIGWICKFCNNFNFESRNKCNRCSKNMKPKTIEEMNKKHEEKRSKKKAKERNSDWLCLNCKNLNYGFRKNCNRCLIERKEIFPSIFLLPNQNINSPNKIIIITHNLCNTQSGTYYNSNIQNNNFNLFNNNNSNINRPNMNINIFSNPLDVNKNYIEQLI